MAQLSLNKMVSERNGHFLVESIKKIMVPVTTCKNSTAVALSYSRSLRIVVFSAFPANREREKVTGVTSTLVSGLYFEVHVSTARPSWSPSSRDE